MASIITEDNIFECGNNTTEKKYPKGKKNGIYEDLDKIIVPEYIKIEANKIYLESNLTSRKGNKLSYILFNCIYNAYKNLGEPEIPKKIAALVGLSTSE